MGSNKMVDLCSANKSMISAMIESGIALGVGNIYYVCQTTNSTVYADLQKKIGTLQYSDGSSALHTTIQSALDATVGNRNDYVIVTPDNTDYDLTAALTMSKRNVHLLCPAGISGLGASNAARIDQNTADTATITLTGDSCEIAGFWFKSTGNSTLLSTTGHICVPTASTGQAANIHHNYFFMDGSGSDNAPAINYYNGGSGNYGNIHHNRFQFMTPSTTFSYGVYLSSANSIFEFNEILVQNGCTVTWGVRMNGAGGAINYNTFIASRAGGGLSAGAFGGAILIDTNDTTGAVGNKGAVGSGTLIEGGTADTSWCDNRSGVNGGATTCDQDADA